MKYYKVIFKIESADSSGIKDDLTIQTAKDVLCGMAAETGFESFEDCEEGICGYVQQQLADMALLDQYIGFFPVEGIRISYEQSEAEDKDWNKTWEEEGFEPIYIEGKCIIHDSIHPVTTNGNDVIDITIEARQAFGTGTHETTHTIVTELLNTDIKDKIVLDCGCGTGILSIVASKLGAKSVTGYDIDEWSVENTIHNSQINGVNNIRAIHGDASILDNINDKFDIVLANINRNILLADMPRFKSVMKENAMLIISGFYTEDADMLKDKAKELSLTFSESKTNNNWCMLVFTNN
ncbi:MAG: 50S ribosomal protein L11 methyltransferase [Prevotellaceae bacterium]|nr:50S ribosomal protein L11 methyltransferase [Prevotellaceae bacterium]